MTTAKPLSDTCGVYHAIETLNPVAAALAALKTDIKYESTVCVVHQQYTDNNSTSIMVAVEWGKKSRVESTTRSTRTAVYKVVFTSMMSSCLLLVPPPPPSHLRAAVRIVQQ